MTSRGRLVIPSPWHQAPMTSFQALSFPHVWVGRAHVGLSRPPRPLPPAGGGAARAGLGGRHRLAGEGAGASRRGCQGQAQAPRRTIARLRAGAAGAAGARGPRSGSRRPWRLPTHTPCPSPSARPPRLPAASLTGSAVLLHRRCPLRRSSLSRSPTLPRSPRRTLSPQRRPEPSHVPAPAAPAAPASPSSCPPSPPPRRRPPPPVLPGLPDPDPSGVGEAPRARREGA